MHQRHQAKHMTRNWHGPYQIETQAETVEIPMAKARSIKRKAGYGHEQKSGQKKRSAEDMPIDAETYEK